MKKLKMLLTVVGILVSYPLFSQTAAFKSNVLSDAFSNVNIGAEFGIAPKFTTEVRGDVSLWNISNDTKWKHASIQPAVRYWFCDKFLRGFVGAHLHGGIYNIGGISSIGGVDLIS